MFIEKNIITKGKRRKIFMLPFDHELDKRINNLNDGVISYFRQNSEIVHKTTVNYITKRIRSNLKNGYLKIYVCDIRKFFENIPHRNLISHLNSILESDNDGHFQKDLEYFLNLFSKHTNSSKGLPTGINVSNRLRLK
jgi:hypothetical protein